MMEGFLRRLAAKKKIRLWTALSAALGGKYTPEYLGMVDGGKRPLTPDLAKALTEAGLASRPEIARELGENVCDKCLGTGLLPRKLGKIERPWKG